MHRNGIVIAILSILIVLAGCGSSDSASRKPLPSVVERSQGVATVSSRSMTSVPSPTPVPSAPATPAPAVAAIVCEGVGDGGFLADVSSLSAPAGTFIHIQFYSRSGEPERTTLLPPGDYQMRLLGRYWKLGPSCTADTAIRQHVKPSIQATNRPNLANPYYVDWSWARNNGFITVGSQPQPVPDIPAP